MSDSTPDPVTDPDEVRDTEESSGNQAKTEAMPPSPVATVPDFAAPSADRRPEPVDVTSAIGAAAEPTPGYLDDDEGHVAVSTKAAQGTSEESEASQGAATVIVQPGKPDGEVAT